MGLAGLEPAKPFSYEPTALPLSYSPSYAIQYIMNSG